MATLRRSLAAALLGAAAASEAAKLNTWAVIAAGSSGFMNYRHQSDACHAYQVLLKDGVPAEQIILMMQDDVANDPSNPFPGQLYNKKGADVPNVYAGCHVDYRGAVVTADLFLKVITGDASGLPAGSKVLKSTAVDRVFLNFVDHGGVGIVAFPNGPFLHSSDLSTALKTMQQKQMFKELVFYMEACESGSMFPDLTPNGKILAVTASNGEESSWGTYCAPDDVAHGKEIGSCLGDLFSVSWMEDSDLGQTDAETLATQIQRVTQRTSQSHVSVFGDTSFEGEAAGGFLSQLLRGAKAKAAEPVAQPGTHVSSRDIAMHVAYTAWQRAAPGAAKDVAWQRLQQVTAARTADERFFHSLAEKACSRSNVKSVHCASDLLNSRMALTDAACHKALAMAVQEQCPRREQESPGGWNSYNLRYSQLLVNLCESASEMHTTSADLLQMVQSECVKEASKVNGELTV